MAAAVRVPLSLLPCAGCAGGGEVNGLPCRECGGRGRAGARRRRFAWRGLAERLASPAGTVVGTVLGWSRTVPGVGGAVSVTAGVSVLAHAAWHWVPVYAVALCAGGLFGLWMDRGL